jgi:uncharacterized protein YaiI (UPF0178 family)
VKIWVDADACPSAVKDIIIRAASRRSVKAIFVANKQLGLPMSPYLAFVQVNPDPDAADSYIVEHAEKHDLVVTQDILLAQLLIPAGMIVIDPRGKKFSQENIGERVALRNFLQSKRDTGEITSGPKPFGSKEKQAFAAAFDQELTRLLRISTSG